MDFSISLDCFAGKAGHFDLLRKPSFTVPVYADKLGLLVFVALLIPGDEILKPKRAGVQKHSGS